MLPEIDFTRIAFAEPAYLWLLAIPALLAVLWARRFAMRRGDARRLTLRRTVPVRQRLAYAGDLPFWLCVTAAVAMLILAVARPHGPAALVRRAGIDLVILQDASASMRVKDVTGDRWQRATRFLRRLGDSLSWERDRIALAVFARIAAPQIRLTTDPNTFFFFLDHLEKAPPFRIEDETTWDTNLERGIYWGLRLIERDEQLHGKSPNAKLFVLLSDGEVWSGEVEKSVKRANEQHVPIHVIGVGTLGGGALPEFVDPTGRAQQDPEAPLRSRLDRQGLQKIARSGGGRYFELDRDGDRNIANSIIDAGRRAAPSLGITEEREDLYWYFLGWAAALAVAGVVFLRERADLWLQVAGTAIVLVGISRLIR